MFLSDLIYPKKCFGCGLDGCYFCDNCRRKCEIREVCPGCGRKNIDGWKHVRCRSNVERLIGGFAYKTIVRSALKRVKFSSSWDILNELFDWWWNEFHVMLSNLSDDWIITWVPMYERKKRKTGFDQAEIFANLLAKKLGIVSKRLLIRKKMTKPQYGLNSRERINNMRGVFDFIGDDLDRGVNILLVDDIWTSGTTMNECAGVLRTHGVRVVWGCVFAL